MSTQTFVLGQEVQHKDSTWLVVRMDTTTTIFENEDGTLSQVDESYVQLRSQTGEFDFIALYERESPFERHSTLKAIPNVPWRVKNGKVQTARG